MIKLFYKIIYLVLILAIPKIVLAEIIITEIMADPTSISCTVEASNKYCDEYVEIYNNSDSSIDISGYTLSDGADEVSACDYIIAWNTDTYGTVSGTNLTFNSTVIPANSYALILDREHVNTRPAEHSAQPYTLSDLVILTTDDSNIGYSINSLRPLTSL